MELKNKTYYISNMGDDASDGTTPEYAWKTFKNVDATAGTLKAGDRVLFERGSTFRGSLQLVSGVTYSAYGDGDKPQLYGSLQNYAVPELWEKDPQNGVWKMDVGSMRDIGNIVFDHDYLNNWAMKRLTKCLKLDFDFYHDRENGLLFLYFEKGNPGAEFKDIQICSNDHILWGKNYMHDILIEDLCVKYTGGHGICFWNGTKNITVRNCEIGCIGGSMLDCNVRYGNGFEVVDNCEDIMVESNYVYHCYDAGITHQSGYQPGCMQRNICFRNNRIEYCNYNIEYYVSTENGMIENTIYEGNTLRYAGYGFGSVNRIGSNTSVLSHICCYTRNMPCKNFVIRNNVFDYSLRKILAIGSPNAKDGLGPTVYGNTYILKKKERTEVAMIRNADDQEVELTIENQREFEDVVAMLDLKPQMILLEE